MEVKSFQRKHYMPYTQCDLYFLGISAMYNMYAKLNFHFICETSLPLHKRINSN